MSTPPPPGHGGTGQDGPQQGWQGGQYGAGQPGQYGAGQPGQYGGGQPGQYGGGQPGQYGAGAPGGASWGQQPGTGPQGQFQPPKPKGRKRSLWASLGVALVAIAVLIVVRIATANASNERAVELEASVGDCVKVSNASAADTDVATIDCSDPAGLYKVSSTTTSGDANCPTADYTTFTETAGNAKSQLCLVANFAEGTCYSGLTGTSDVYEVVDCGSPQSEGKVALRVDGQADESLCDEYQADLLLAVAYPDPKLTYCLVVPES